MGLLDTVIGKQATGDQGGLASSVMHLLTEGGGGGLNGLVQSFESQGLGQIVSSWVGKGENKPISPDEVEQGLGSERLQHIAGHSGIPVEDVKAALANILPGLIDKLTPDGKVPEGGLLEKALSILKTRTAS